MGLMTELFVASVDEARTYDGDGADRLPCVQLGGLTNLEFELLWAILSGEEWTPDTHSLHEVASTDETWTFRFPIPYVEKLRGLEPSAIRAAAESWATTDELACEPADAESILTSLVTLARTPADASLGVYLWTSL